MILVLVGLLNGLSDFVGVVRIELQDFIDIPEAA